MTAIVIIGIWLAVAVVVGVVFGRILRDPQSVFEDDAAPAVVPAQSEQLPLPV